MTIKIELGTIYENYISILDLLKAHSEELTRNKEVMKLSPDLDKYMQIEEAGKSYSLFVKDIRTNEIVGYSINLVTNHLHYSDLIYANNDVLFLRKDYRNLLIGRELIVASEEEAKKRGAKMYLLHAKPDTALASMLPDAGYEVQDIIYSKVL